jgi:hypothetical protein
MGLAELDNHCPQAEERVEDPDQINSKLMQCPDNCPFKGETGQLNTAIRAQRANGGISRETRASLDRIAVYCRGAGIFSNKFGSQNRIPLVLPTKKPPQ